jgi:hypothetical protein
MATMTSIGAGWVWVRSLDSHKYHKYTNLGVNLTLE